MVPNETQAEQAWLDDSDTELLALASAVKIHRRQALTFACHDR